MNADHSTNNSPANRDPILVGDVVVELFDPETKQIAVDSEAEKARQRLVAERMADVLAQTRTELIEASQAGEPVDRQDLDAIGQDLLEARARSEALQQAAEAEDTRP